MISLSNLFEDIQQQQQPPQQPGQPVQQQPVQQPIQQQQANPVQTQQKPGLWNRIKSGYDNINNKYEAAVDATKNALLSPTALQIVGSTGLALTPLSPMAGVVGMGAMQASRALYTAKLTKQLADNTRMQYQNNRQQQYQQPR